MFNYRHPGPRRVWKVGSELRLTTSFPVDPVDPLDPVDPPENSKAPFVVDRRSEYKKNLGKPLDILVLNVKKALPVSTGRQVGKNNLFWVASKILCFSKIAFRVGETLLCLLKS